MISGICSLFGGLLNFLYELFGDSYGWALLAFTLIVNLILLPLTLKQQKSTAAMQLIQPELQKLQAKYKNDKEKLNTEMMKLYKEKDINPMGGCMPLLIQMPIILILYQVIIKPLSYMQGLTAEQVSELQNLVSSATGTEIAANNAYNQVSLAADAAKLSPEILSKLSFDFSSINFSFFGLDLGAIPSISEPSLLWIVPILAGVTTYLLSWYTMKAQNTQKKDGAGAENNMANQMQTMNKIMPLITVFFAFSLAAGIGFYWIANNVFRFIQQVIVTKLMTNKKDPLVM